MIAALLLHPALRWALGAVAVVLALGIAYGVVYHQGVAYEKRKWDAAIQASIDKGTKAAADAERSVAAHPAPSVRDRWNRD
jgi:predicted RND superfamily exporter protein